MFQGTRQEEEDGATSFSIPLAGESGGEVLYLAKGLLAN